jgi:hypothetical protein
MEKPKILVLEHTPAMERTQGQIDKIRKAGRINKKIEVAHVLNFEERFSAMLDLLLETL